MRKLLPFLGVLFVLVATFSAVAQTNVSGTITSNTSWTISGSPYTLTSMVGIPAGVTLTIQPGVEVSGAFDLLVKGTIICTGKPDSLIKIKSTRVLFKSTLLTNSKIGYTQFDNNGGVQLADESEFIQDPIKNSGTLTVTDATFLNTAFANTKGYNSGATLIINHSKFLNAGMTGNYPRAERIYLTNCEIDSSTLNSQPYHDGFSLKNCRVSESKLYMGCCGANYSIEDSKIIHSVFGDGGGHNGIFQMLFTRTLFYKSPVNLGSNLTINHCIFVNDESDPNPGLTMASGTIDSSSFIGTKDKKAIRFTDNSGNVQIRNCTFSNYADALTISNIASLLANNNNFNQVAGYILKNGSAKDLDAKNNWWGTTNASTIATSIYDGNDDINLGKVDFSGLLSALQTTAPITPPANAVKRKINGGVELKWKPNAEADVAGYKIHSGQSTGYSFSNAVNAGNVSSYFIPGASITGAFAVTAYDTDKTGTTDQIQGHESWFSNFVTAGINNLDSAYCSNAAAVNLSAAPAGGIYSGDGINGNVFNPAQAGLGKHKLLYIYPAPNNNTNDTVSFFVNIYKAPTGGSIIATATTICSGENVKLTLSNYSGSIQWQSSTNNTSWKDLPGEIAPEYITGVLTETTYYRGVLSNGVCTSAYSNGITILVNPVSAAGTLSVNKTKICLGDSALLSLPTYTGTIQWQSSGDSIAWTTITGADSSAYNTGAINLKTYYRAIVTSGVCTPYTSEVRSVTVNNLPEAVVTPKSPTSFCNGGSALLNATVNNNYLYQWEINNQAISGATAAAYTATQTGNYAVKVTDSKTGCMNVSALLHINNIALAVQPVSICIVGVDSASGKNFIAWEKPLTTKIDSFYIYKETFTSNVYTRIGKVDYNSMSTFIDVNSHPKVQSDRYKISILDSCGVETAPSDLHKTIHLNINQGSGTTWNLIWEDYVGFTVSNYRIYRGTSPTTMSLIGTTTAGSTSFSDFSAPTGLVYYLVEVARPSACNPSFVASYASSKSNIASNNPNDIAENGNPFSNIEVYPVPNDGVFTVSFYSGTSEKAEMKIVDVVGAVIFKEDNISLNSGKQSKTINLGDVSKGIYFVQFQSKGGSFTKKIVVNK